MDDEVKVPLARKGRLGMYIIQLKKYRKRALWRVIVVRRIALK
jgi:hypothetical protein